MTSAFPLEILWRNFSIFTALQGKESFTFCPHQIATKQGFISIPESLAGIVRALGLSQINDLFPKVHISGNKAELLHLVARSHLVLWIAAHKSTHHLNWHRNVSYWFITSHSGPSSLTRTSGALIFTSPAQTSCKWGQLTLIWIYSPWWWVFPSNSNDREEVLKHRPLIYITLNSHTPLQPQVCRIQLCIHCIAYNYSCPYRLWPLFDSYMQI